MDEDLEANSCTVEACSDDELVGNYHTKYLERGNKIKALHRQVTSQKQTIQLLQSDLSVARSKVEELERKYVHGIRTAEENSFENTMNIPEELGGARTSLFIESCWKEIRAVAADARSGKGCALRRFQYVKTGNFTLDEAMIPPVTIVAPHLVRPQVKKCGDAQCDCSSVTTYGLGTPVVLYAMTGPELLVPVLYQCYKNEKGKSGYATKKRVWKSTEPWYLTAMSCAVELSQVFFSGVNYYAYQLIDFIYSCYTKSRANVGALVESVRAVYGRAYLERVGVWLEQQLPTKHIADEQGSLMRFGFTHKTPDLRVDLHKARGAWKFVTAETVVRLVEIHAEGLRVLQDKFLIVHAKNSVVLSGDHVFSMVSLLKVPGEKKGRRNNKSMYGLVNERQMIIGMVRVDGESYGELEPFFRELEPWVRDTVQGIYVDKCCNRGGFKAAIQRLLGDVWVKLDLFHAVRRLSKVLNRRDPLHNAFDVAVRNAHWKYAPGVDVSAIRLHSEVDASAKYIPDRETLLTQVRAVVEDPKYQAVVKTAGVQKWWKNHQHHINSDCLSDPATRLAFTDVEGVTFTARGSVKNESVHRRGNATTRTGVACGETLLNAQHRAVMCEWNLSKGARFGWWLPCTSDLTLLKRLRDMVSTLWGASHGEQLPFFHPAMEDAFKLENCPHFFSNYTPPSRSSDLKDLPEEVASSVDKIRRILIEQWKLPKATVVAEQTSIVRCKVTERFPPAKFLPRGYSVAPQTTFREDLCAALWQIKKPNKDAVIQFELELCRHISEHASVYETLVPSYGRESLHESLLKGPSLATVPRHAVSILTAVATMLRKPVTVIHASKEIAPDIIVPLTSIVVARPLPISSAPVFIMVAPGRMLPVLSTHWLLDVAPALDNSTPIDVTPDAQAPHQSNEKVAPQVNSEDSSSSGSSSCSSSDSSESSDSEADALKDATDNKPQPPATTSPPRSRKRRRVPTATPSSTTPSSTIAAPAVSGQGATKWDLLAHWILYHTSTLVSPKGKIRWTAILAAYQSQTTTFGTLAGSAQGDPSKTILSQPLPKLDASPKKAMGVLTSTHQYAVKGRGLTASIYEERRIAQAQAILRAPSNQES